MLQFYDKDDLEVKVWVNEDNSIECLTKTNKIYIEPHWLPKAQETGDYRKILDAFFMIQDEEKAIVYDYLSGYGLNDIKCLRSTGGNSLSISTSSQSTLTTFHFFNLESNKMSKLEFDKQQLMRLIIDLKETCENMRFLDEPEF